MNSPFGYIVNSCIPENMTCVLYLTQLNLICLTCSCWFIVNGFVSLQITSDKCGR